MWDSIYRAFELVPFEKEYRGFDKALRHRLGIISVEDVNDNTILPQIDALRNMYFFSKKDDNWYEIKILVCRAVEILVSAEKGRDTCARCVLYPEIAKKEIPEYALDRHTRRGKWKYIKEWYTRHERVKEQNDTLSPKTKPDELYQTVFDRIDDIQLKGKEPAPAKQDALF